MKLQITQPNENHKSTIAKHSEINQFENHSQRSLKYKTEHFYDTHNGHKPVSRTLKIPIAMNHEIETPPTAEQR